MKKYSFTIYHVTKWGQLNFTEKLTTKKMDLKRFEEVLRAELKRHKKGTYFFEIHDTNATLHVARNW